MPYWYWCLPRGIWLFIKLVVLWICISELRNSLIQLHVLHKIKKFYLTLNCWIYLFYVKGGIKISKAIRIKTNINNIVVKVNELNMAIVTFRGLALHRKKTSETLFECTRKNGEWQIWWRAFISEKNKWKQNEKRFNTHLQLIRPKNSSILLFRVKHWFYDGSLCYCWV